jgi:hypothetical protein
MKLCCYCGKLIKNIEKEHVIPRCLYPKNYDFSNVKMITIPACSECNRSFSDAEAHFRNIFTLISDPNNISRKLFKKVRKSLYKVDGKKRLTDILNEIAVNGGHWIIYPAKDEKVIVILKKIIRGLSCYYDLLYPIREKQVLVNFNKYIIPENFLNEMNYHHQGKDIIEWRYVVMNDKALHSFWLLRFFKKVEFYGFVFISEKSKENYN